MSQTRRFELGMSPHVGSGRTTRRIMFDVVIALLPALAAAVWFFGPWALLLVGLGIGSAVGAEYLCLRFMKKPVSFAFDGSAMVTGILLAFNVPPAFPGGSPSSGPPSRSWWASRPSAGWATTS